MINLTVKQVWFVFSVAFIGIISIAVFNSCRKIEYIQHEKPDSYYTEKFFSVPEQTPDLIKRIAAAIKIQNDVFGFVPKLSKKQGLPRWDKSKIISSSGLQANARPNTKILDSVAMIPLIQEDSNIVHSFILCHVSSNTLKVRLFDGSSAPSYPRKSALDTLGSTFVAATCMYLHHKVFGTEWFEIKDSSLFYINSTTPCNMIHMVPDITPVTVSDVGYSYSISTTRYSQNNARMCVIDPITWFDYQFFADLIDDSPTYTFSPIPNTGGGGSWWDSDPCSIYNNIPGDPCTQDGPLPWKPKDFVLNEEFNPYDYDQIDISNDIRDSFPCLYNLLHDTLQSPNFLAQNILFKTFGVGKKVNLTFTVDWTLGETDKVAYESKSGTDNDFTNQSSAPGQFATHVFLNPYFIKQGARESMISTIVHESVHAYIKYMFAQYRRQLVDSNTLKASFPAHWSYYTNNKPSQEIQHQQMAQAYIQEIASIVKQFFNPAASEYEKNRESEALAWGGLYQDAGWVSLSNNLYITDSCEIKAINWVGENTNKSTYGTYTPTGCSPFTLPFDTGLKLTSPCR